VNEEWFYDNERVRAAVGMVDEAPDPPGTSDKVCVCARTCVRLCSRACFPAGTTAAAAASAVALLLSADASTTRALAATPPNTQRPTKPQCLICFETYARPEMRSAACKHGFCLDCWGGYVAAAVNSGPSVLDLRCPLPGCKAEVRWRALLACTLDAARRIAARRFAACTNVHTHKQLRHTQTHAHARRCLWRSCMRSCVLRPPPQPPLAAARPAAPWPPAALPAAALLLLLPPPLPCGSLLKARSP
jgi:hypothetical protein